jgi:hypothetical protein
LRLNCQSDWLTVVVDHPLDAVSKNHDMKVDQQSDGNIQQAEVGEQLSIINRMQRVFKFGLDYHPVFHDEGLLESRTLTSRAHK